MIPAVNGVSPALDLEGVVGGTSATGLTETVRAICRSVAQFYLQEPRVLAAVLAETLAPPRQISPHLLD